VLASRDELTKKLGSPSLELDWYKIHRKLRVGKYPKAKALGFLGFKSFRHPHQFNPQPAFACMEISRVGAFLILKRMPSSL
jgi:hypothetical protein